MKTFFKKIKEKMEELEYTPIGVFTINFLAALILLALVAIAGFLVKRAFSQESIVVTIVELIIIISVAVGIIAVIDDQM